MESKKAKDLLRKYKKARQVSSSDSTSSSDSESGSSSESFSSSSSAKKAARRKPKKLRALRHSSSSSEEEHVRKREKHACHKKLEGVSKSHLKRKLKEAKAKKRALSPSLRRRSGSPPQKMKKILSGSLEEKKHHALVMKERLREKEREHHERERREREKEREREREKLRHRERERLRGSRSPQKQMKSRSPKPSRCHEMKRNTPMEKHASPREMCALRRERSPSDRRKELKRRHDESRERERRDRERAEREAARNKEREEALARCQERQRERERLAREKARREKEKEYKTDRLLPRPAEREMAIAAAQRAASRDRSIESEARRQHLHPRGPREPIYERGYERERDFIEHEHRAEREERREHERDYIMVRRREMSPSSQNIGHYGDRVRPQEREMYPEEERFERERGYPSRRYPPIGENEHRRELNWERERENPPHEREVERGKGYLPERSAQNPRDWQQSQDWHRQDKQWDDNWQRGKPPLQEEENWDADTNFPQQKWEKPQVKHDSMQKEHPPHNQHSQHNLHHQHPSHSQHTQHSQHPQHAPHPQHLPQHAQHPPHQQQQHGPRRWVPDWRNRQNEERQHPPNQGQGNFRHGPNTPQQPGNYNHERPEPMYRKHHHGPAHLQHHGPGGYHPRPHFPSKRQMTYTNPNPMVHPPAQTTTAASNISNTTINSQKNLNQISGGVSTTPLLGTGPTSSTSATQNPVSTVMAPEDNVTLKSANNSQDKSVIKETTTISADIKAGDNQASSSQSNEEPIPDDLSEISDDADEILNKDEEILYLSGLKEQTGKSQMSEIGNSKTSDEKIEGMDGAMESNSNFELNQQSPPEKFSENNHQSEENESKIQDETKDFNDDDLDFEEISDGELEEDGRTKNLGDALGVDWASLVEESKNRNLQSIENNTSAKEKWQPYRIILDVGISFNLAGEKFAKEILQNSKQKLEEKEESLSNNKIDSNIIKNEIQSENVFLKKENQEGKISLATEIKKEVKNEDQNSKEVKCSPLACVQVGQKKSLKEKQNLVFNACGRNSRALSARKDLSLRRKLCGLPVKEVDLRPTVSEHMRMLAMKAFQRAVEEVK